MSETTECRSEHYDVGTLLDDRYRLTEFVGSGGMACVYKAQEVGSPHYYAIKFLKSEYHNQSYLIDFFRDEASSMRDLAHPNIVRFYRFVNQEAYSYIVMDYVEGFALSDIIKKMYKQDREIPLDEVVRIMVQVARALDAIHREGFVHRDIKPSNVLIERQTGQTFLTDLGITSATNTRIIGAGTLAYMPPETNETGIADHRADIYSYGIMFFEMLAKQRPFRVKRGMRGSEAEDYLSHQHKEAPIPAITDYRPDLPAELDNIMRRALAKNPDDRYDNILTLAQDVHAALRHRLSADLRDFASISHRQIAPPDVRQTQDAPALTSRNLLASIGLLVGAVVLIIGLVLLMGNPGENVVPANIIGANSTATATQTVTATPTATPTATLTPTPNPLEQQPYYPLVSGMAALAEPDSSGALQITPIDDAPLHYLRVGRVDGFRVMAQAENLNAVEQYGIAFRVVDSQNYHRVIVTPAAGTWAIVTVINGEESVQANGSFPADDVPQRLRVTGRSDFFEVEIDDTVVDFVSDAHPRGSVALWVMSRTDTALRLNDLRVGLIGAEAVAAADTTPTPADGIADPRRFLRADVRALLDTNDVINSAIDCPRYIDIYESLERHLQSSNRTVRTLAQETLNAGEIIYSRCRSESPAEPLSFVNAIQDYLEWERELRAILQQLEQDR